MVVPESFLVVLDSGIAVLVIVLFPRAPVLDEHENERSQGEGILFFIYLQFICFKNVFVLPYNWTYGKLHKSLPFWGDDY
jgi:hypothetical protein